MLAFLIYWFLHPFKWHQGFHGHSIWLPFFSFLFFFFLFFFKMTFDKNVVNVITLSMLKEGFSSGFWDFLKHFVQRSSYFFILFPPFPKFHSSLLFFFFFHPNLWKAFGTTFFNCLEVTLVCWRAIFPSLKGEKKLFLLKSLFM